MRYLEGDSPDPAFPHGESMHAMLAVSALLSLFIGIGLLLLGLKGRVMWLTYWSLALILFSILYLGLELFNFFV